MRDVIAIKNSNGFSLIELMVAVAMMSIVGLGTLQLFDDMSTRQATLRYKSQIEAFKTDLGNVLSNRDACLNTLGGNTVASSMDLPVAGIMDHAGNPMMETGQVYGEYPVRVSSIRAEEFVEQTPTTGSLIVNFRFQATDKVYGPPELERRIQVNVVKDATNQIIECTADPNSQDGFWQTPPGGISMTTILKVGVGTNDPQVALDVKGGFIHGQLECRTVVGPRNIGESVASCAVDEYVISGGGNCFGGHAGLHDGFLHDDRPLADLSGWMADCYKRDVAHPGDSVQVEAYAYCCKK